MASCVGGPWAMSGESTGVAAGAGTISTITELAAASSASSSGQCMSASAVQPTCATTTNIAAAAQRRSRALRGSRSSIANIMAGAPGQGAPD